MPSQRCREGNKFLSISRLGRYRSKRAILLNVPLKTHRLTVDGGHRLADIRMFVKGGVLKATTFTLCIDTK